MEHITSSKRWLDYRTATTIVCWLGEHPYEPITYGVLAQKMASIFGEDPIHPLGFRCSLGRIQDECRHFGEPDDSAPCLPALVVTKATGRPGEGFYGVYCENRGKDPNDLDEHDRDALLESEQRQCAEYTDWSSFLEHLSELHQRALEKERSSRAGSSVKPK
ncbi:MAG: hypothetical protein Q4C41_03745 [Eggerthellaceae bacterium]|nr:hypothetical protein [Eggerthellaceae bacterium]